jgi:hypothetical protein
MPCPFLKLAKSRKASRVQPNTGPISKPPRSPDGLGEATLQPINSLEKAVETKSPALFTKAFDQLTGACNSCHQAAEF